MNQYRRRVGVFNNCKLLLKKTHGPPSQKNILKTRQIEILIFLPVVTVRYTISLYSAQNIRLLRWSFFHSLYFISVLSHIRHVCLYSIAIKRTGDIEENPNPKSFSKLRFSRSQKFVSRSVLVSVSSNSGRFLKLLVAT